MKLSKALTQAYVVQDVAFLALTSWKREHEASTGDGSLALGEYGASQLAQIVRAWETAQERVRINRGKPLPGSLKPEGSAKQPKRFSQRKAEREASASVADLAAQLATHQGTSQPAGPVVGASAPISDNPSSDQSPAQGS